MAGVQDFVDKVNANFAKVAGDLDSVKGQIGDLNAKIQALQNSPGELSPADQGALDDIAAKAQALADKADSLAAPVTPPAPTA